MSLFNRTYTFTDGTTAYGSQVEAEIGNIVSVLNNLNTAATNWGLISVLHATSVPLVADCSSGTQHIADFKNNNVIKASVSSAGVITATGATMTGAIAMGSNKITGLANGSASSDAAAFGQIPTTPISVANGGTASSTGKGLILQTVTSSTTSDLTTSSGTYADITGLSRTITPTYSGSKIRIFCSLNLSAQPAVASGCGVQIQLLKDGSTLLDFGQVLRISQTSGTATIFAQTRLDYDDAPGDTTLHTYKLQWKIITSGTGEINGGGGTATSFIRCEEIGQ